MWGIIPAAGAGSRIQPLAFSKELLPVGSRVDGTDERPDFLAMPIDLFARMEIGLASMSVVKLDERSTTVVRVNDTVEEAGS